MEHDNRPPPRLPTPGMIFDAKVHDIDNLNATERWNLTMYALYANRITMKDSYGRTRVYIADPDDLVCKEDL